MQGLLQRLIFGRSVHIIESSPAALASHDSDKYYFLCRERLLERQNSLLADKRLVDITIMYGHTYYQYDQVLGVHKVSMSGNDGILCHRKASQSLTEHSDRTRTLCLQSLLTGRRAQGSG